MRKTFVSQASASMQQYAQRDKLEYWFAVPHERYLAAFPNYVGIYVYCPLQRGLPTADRVQVVG